MQSVVITGSTRGIGLGLAREILRRGHAVTVSGRTDATVARAVGELTTELGDAARVHGVACDVASADDVRRLWEGAAGRFGRVDIWINNAGIGHAPVRFWELELEAAVATVDVNLLGTLHGCHVAMRGMLAQGSGVIFTMEGFGSTGMKREGMSVYGATKAALRYLTDSIAREAEGTCVVVAAMSPGIVATDLLLGGYTGHPETWEKAKRFLAIAADKVETVAPFLAEHALATTKSGTRIEWLTPGRLAFRFAASPFVRRDVIPS